MDIDSYQTLRVAISLSGLLVFFLLGLLFPFRSSPWFLNKKRWANNLILNFGNGLMIRFLIPVSLIQLTSSQGFSQFGLFHQLQLPTLVSITLGVLILDCAIYWQHRLFHKIPLLWRLHRVHHSDPEIDTTSAARFHPIEILLSFAIKAAVVFVFGISAPAIVIFEVLLNFAAMFNHTNIQILKSMEPILQKIIITPDLHRIHHSSKPKELNTNFGFSISLWDLIFSSFLNKVEGGQKNFQVGLKNFREPKEQTLLALLKQPFVKP